MQILWKNSACFAKWRKFDRWLLQFSWNFQFVLPLYQIIFNSEICSRFLKIWIVQVNSFYNSTSPAILRIVSFSSSNLLYSLTLLHFQGDKAFFTSELALLSQENVMCSVAPISSLDLFFDSWKVDTKLLIYNVVAIRRKEDFQEFNEIVKRHTIDGVPLFLIFLNMIEDMSKIYALLMSNCLNLNFNSRLLVKFYNDSMIKEMHSICRNEVQLHNFAKWTNETGLKKFNNQNLFSKRNSLQGCPLNIVYFNVIIKCVFR